MKNKAIYFVLVVFSLLACSKKEIPIIEGKFDVSFQSLTINQQFGTNTFLINCSFGIENGRNARVESQGVCWSTKNPKPTIRDASVSETQQPNVSIGSSFNIKTPPLSPDSVYFLNAFVVIDNKFYYSTDKGGKATILQPFNCKISVVQPYSVKYLSSTSNNFTQEGGTYESNFVADGSVWFINPRGRIQKYDVGKDIWQNFDKPNFGFNPDINQFNKLDNFEIFSVKNQVFTAFGSENDSNKPSGKVFEFLKETQTWKAQTPILLDENRNYKTWFATDSSCIFISYPNNNSQSYRPIFWEYKPARNSFVQLPEVKEFTAMDKPKSVQFGDKVIFISKNYLEENFSIYSFEPSTNQIKKLLTLDQFCGNYTAIKNLWIANNTLHFYIERIEPRIATGISLFGMALGRFNLENNQLKPFLDIRQIYEGRKIEYPPYIHFFTDGQRTFALDLSIFLPFQFVITD